ncbi:L-lysine 6-monooxygenase NADPH-requiring [Nitzschia inconspicua]|uniref:L-lysine 6-monooxygenase NADPH-requiring n=1 Tax=Nitzschia inconspicua TaxID=303405 RepID=A0A9K3Q5P3_9STRA|nr:L-lysine 6-monooxygenase NADPH-requiring [Nitzschia inconspicua]
MNKLNEEQVFDVCIIGAGPAGLATLSALQSPYSLDSNISDSQKERAVKSLKQQQGKKMSQERRICVIDPSNGWLSSWKSNFERLEIQFLRSPALAHPDMFDPHALLSYAVQHGREDELLESGCGDIKKLLALGQSQIGLWKLPSTKLFVDFCLDLAKELDHTFVGNTTVVSIQKNSRDVFELGLSNGKVVQAESVVLATGAIGKPIVPVGIQGCPCWRHWTQAPKIMDENDPNRYNLPVMVVGGGLTAVQVALNELRRAKASSNSPSVILVSNRPLVEKHFDIDIAWFDLRTTNKCIADFYHNPMEARKQALRQARRGGSVPPLYMKELFEAEQNGRLLCLVGEVERSGNDDLNPSRARICIHHRDTTRPRDGHNNPVNEATFAVSFYQVKELILACGIQPDCERLNSLTGMIQTKWPTRIESGLPCVTQDLRWRENVNLFVVGALGSLNIGPDAGNLMGIRRAAQIVASTLGSRNWLRESVLVNPFEALNWSDDDDDDSTVEGEDEEKEEQSLEKSLLETSDMSDTAEESISSSDCSLA